VVDGGVVYYQICDDSDASVASRLRELNKVTEGTVTWIDGVVITDVVPMIAPGRREKWLEPKAVDVQSRKIVQLAGKPEKIPDSIAVAISKRFEIDGVNNRILISTLSIFPKPMAVG
jgi:hypothetical protein